MPSITLVIRSPTERSDDNKDMVVDGAGRYLERTAQHYVLVVDEDGMTQQALPAHEGNAIQEVQAMELCY